MFFKDFVSVKRKKIKKGASQTYDTPSCFYVVGAVVISVGRCGGRMRLRKRYNVKTLIERGRQAKKPEK